MLFGEGESKSSKRREEKRFDGGGRDHRDNRDHRKKEGRQG